LESCSELSVNINTVLVSRLRIYCLAGIIRGNRVKIPKEQDMPCTLQLTMIYVGITFFLIVGYICHQIT
ncbi:hypothetical protein, partial [Escherichia coli]|uniref:hypothetical protein n=1 Tax=Escherichia coli TaxID=562 RepID=UPI001BDBA961